MQNPLAHLAAHLTSNLPYFTLGHDMDSMYSVHLAAYSGTDEMEWEATITTEEARILIYQAARLFDSEGELMRNTDFLALLTRLDAEWAEMCNPAQVG